MSVGSKVRPRTFGRISIGSVVLFILRSRFVLYSAVLVVLSGLSV